MYSASLIQLVKCRWREFRREPSAFFFVIFMPILWLLILGSIFSKPSKDALSIGLRGDDSALIARLETEFSGKGIETSRENSEILAANLRNGTIALIMSLESGRIIYHYDPTHPNSKTQRDRVDGIAQKVLVSYSPIPTDDQLISIPGSRYVDFLVPGLLAMSILTSSIFGTGMTVVVNRRSSLLKRYLATPMKPLEYIASFIVGRGIILLFEGSALLIVAALVMNFHIAGSFSDFLIVSLLGTSCFTAMAFLIGCRTADTGFYNGIANLLMLPLLLLSGVWFSRANFPSWLQTLMSYLPLSALVDCLRKIALEGTNLALLQREILVLLAFTLFFAAAARRLFRWV